MNTLGLGPGIEFDLIRAALDQDARIRADLAGTTKPGRMARLRSTENRVSLGPGSDCTIITSPTTALSIDAAVEGVHFHRDWLTPTQIGYRAAAAALSDLAAAGALPIGLLVTLAVNAADVPEFALGIMAGISRAAAEQGAALLGGDMTRSAGPVMIDVVAAGEPDRLITRGGARPGDELWVTGTLGAAAAAVREWLAGRQPPQTAVQAFAEPTARIAESRWLVQQGVVSAMIDLSDGLAGDAAHLASASNVRILLDPDLIPVSPAARAVVDDRAGALGLALGGGEDYELCFAAATGVIGEIERAFEARFEIPLTRVGHVVEGEGTGWIGGDSMGLPLTGYTHFADERD